MYVQYMWSSAITLLSVLTVASSLRIMQYNVEWLFLDYYANMDCPGDGCTWKNGSTATVHMEYVASVIDKFRPDIINVCEVEGEDELNAVIGVLYPNNYVAHLLHGTDTSTGQNVGIITNVPIVGELTRTNATHAYPVKGSMCYYDCDSTNAVSGEKGVSKHSVAMFDMGEFPSVALISVHLLAYPTDPDRCSEREAQAGVIADLVAQHVAQGSEVIVIGDFNDYDGDVLDENDSQPTSDVLSIIKGDVLTNVATHIPKQTRGTNWWDKNGDCLATSNEFVMIDHILMSKGLADRVRNVFVYQGYAEYCGKLNSDHFPVIVDLDLNLHGKRDMITVV